MKDYQEKVCKNWFMRKSGKRWIFGCALLAFGAFMLGTGGTVEADEITGEAAPAQTSQPADQAAWGSDESAAAPATEIPAAQPSADQGPVEGPAAAPLSDQSASPVQAGSVSAADKSPAKAEPDQPLSSSKAKAKEPTPAQAALAIQVQPASSSTDEAEKAGTEAAQPDRAERSVSPASAAQSSQAEPLTADQSQSGFKSNLEQGQGDQNGSWEVREEGLYSDARGKGDSFYYSQSQGRDFIYSTDVTFLQKEGAAALVFRSNNNPSDKNSYAVNIDVGSNNVKFWRWQGGRDYQFINEKHIEPTADNQYNLKVVALGSWISYYVNDVLVASTGDYTLQKEDKGQNTYIPEGAFGLLNWNGQMIFQNTYFKELTEALNPELEDIQVTSTVGDVEQKGQFTAPITIQYVQHEAETIDLTVRPKNPAAKVTVTDAAGKVYEDFKNIPLAVGANYLTVKSTVLDADGQEISVSYRVNIHRRQAAQVYYNELYRGQFHYSVKDGWANDPNGLVYYNGTYHFFYQFYDDTKWGPMHWAHATSKDLIHWEEQHIAFYPDANGAMFSGSIVADTTNSSGLFDDDKGGLVALITADGNGQRIKLAYSKDEGRTWTKVDQIAADWTDDPLQSMDFRDPKVFRWEDKWFMVIAGGPLRIYSSDNLRSWQVESTYANLHTECPDLYPLRADDGSLKWVLSRGGRAYKVGDFRQVDGKWTFVPDADYEQQDQVMNFGKDSYAAMTYYVQDFGSKAHSTLPDVIAVNWMNTWEDYCNLVADTVGQKFNGTFNLNLKMGLIKQDGKYLLAQTPIEAYKTLREEGKAIQLQDVDVTEKNDLFKDFQGSQYELVSHFRPAAGTKKVGFNLRVGDGELTKVVYDLETETLSIDRSKSGVILSNKFAQIDSQSVKRNADGSIDLHLYVDRSSVEVFAKGDTVAGANQIFPAPSSLGLSVFAEGEAAKADLALYPLTGIWKDKLPATKALELVQASPLVNNLYVGDSVDLKAYIMPAEAPQDVSWTVDQPDLVSIKEDGNKLQVTALQRGTVKVTATSKENPYLSKTFTVHIRRNDFKTNLPGLTAVSGKWYVDGESLYDQNTSANDYYMSSQKIPAQDYSLDVDIKYQRGLINIFYASENMDPRNAYSIQFGDNDSIRLYRFMGDTIAESSMNGKRLNDGNFHHVKVTKTSQGVKVAVDGVDYLSHDFDQVDPYYRNAYSGLGLWDGDLEARNFFVTSLADPAVHKEDLQKAVAAAADLDPSRYTDESVAAYQTALAAARQILADPTAEQTSVDQALTALQAAVQGLVLRPSSQVTPDEGVKDLVAENPFLEVTPSPVPFATITRENPNLEKGQRRLLVAGQNGRKLVLTEILNGQRTAKGEEIISPAVDEIVEIGSKGPAQPAPDQVLPANPGLTQPAEPTNLTGPTGPAAQIRAEGLALSAHQPAAPRQSRAEAGASLPATGSQASSLWSLLGLSSLGLAALSLSSRKTED